MDSGNETNGVAAACEDLSPAATASSQRRRPSSLVYITMKSIGGTSKDRERDNTNPSVSAFITPQRSWDFQALTNVLPTHAINDVRVVPLPVSPNQVIANWKTLIPGSGRPRVWKELNSFYGKSPQMDS
nr:LINE-type retrotransposon LIb DNA [Ipomoea trifida]